MSMFYRILSRILVLAIVAPAVPARDAPSEDESIERILELERQIEDLEAELSPAARERLERRRAGRSSLSQPSAPEASAASAPVEAPNEEITIPDPSAVDVAEVVSPPPSEAPPRRRLRRPSCNFLEMLDENGDGRLTALDRHWRHLYVWSDKNGDRQAQENEVDSVYARDIREISTHLTTFVRKKGTVGDIRVEDFLRLDVRGDGFGGVDDGILVVNATRLKRGSGPELRSAAGEGLEGFQPFQEGLTVQIGDGEATELVCP